MQADNTTPSFELWPFIVAGVAAVGFVLKEWIIKFDPRLIIVWLHAPLMRPLHMKIDKIQRVIDHLPGADAAHAAVNEQDEHDKRWGK